MWLLPLSLVFVDLVLPLSLVFVDLVLPWSLVFVDLAAAALPHVCDLFPISIRGFRAAPSGSASVSAQECGPVWLDTGQTDGKLCLRAHSQEYCKK